MDRIAETLRRIDMFSVDQAGTTMDEGIAKAIQTLVTYVARLLNLSPDMSHFAEAIQDFRTQCDQAVARDRATR